MKPPFLGRFKSILISYDPETLIVEVDGFTDGFYENLITEADVNDPQSYALGIADMLEKLYPSIPVTVCPVEVDDDFCIDEDSQLV